MSTPSAYAPNRHDRRRQHASMTLSLLIHAAILLVLIAHRPMAGAGPLLAEIDYVAALEATPAAVVPAVVPAPAPPQPAEEQQHFRRVESRAEEAPAPQSDFAIADRMSARLEALQQKRANMVAAPISAPVPSQWSAAAVPAAGPSRPAPVSLQRGTPTSARLSLDRGVPVATRLDPATVALPRPAEAEAAGSATTASRDLAGARITGPVADRPVLSHMTPVYPEWAKRDAVEGSVTLRFFVRADGTIKENVLVTKTAGFEDFDQSAVTALLQWRFQPLAPGHTGEQWGAITFHFKLREAS